MRFAQPRQRRRTESIVAMINVFLVLIFFMMAARIAPPQPFDVTPPQATSQARPGQSRTVYLSEDGALAFGAARGAAVWAAMMAAGILCSTWPKGCGGTTVFITNGVGAPLTMHSGQKNPSPESAAAVVTVPSSASTTLSMPAPAQIIVSVCGLTI